MPINIADLIKPAAAASPYLKICIFGDPSAGKTTLAAGSPKPLLVDCERGATVLLQTPELASTPVVTLRSLDEMLQLFEYLMGAGSGLYETIIIDTVSELTKLFLDSTIKEGGGNAYSPSMSNYEQRNQQSRRLLSDLLGLPMNVILLSHVELVDINGTKKKAPALSVKAREGIMGLMDVVAYMYVEVVPAPTSEKPTATVKKRFLQTLQTNLVEAKNRIRLPDYIEDPTMDSIMKAYTNSTKPVAILPTIQPTMQIANEAKEYKI